MLLPKLKVISQSLDRLMARFRAFLAESRAVSTVEYALITVAVVVVVGSGAAVMSGAFSDLFDDLEAEIEAQSTAVQELGDEGDTTTDE